ncbi:Wiskott-Aldrich syndrome protein family member 1 [Eumeta japonica]|uniref:Wiskott-Aldrich syndrome protein family member 1 n=1 Tax=Eumeta variegata TaxID=151549 RepID=A0A4C1Z983_EUMVA|nr:Wiskott-Aldrich syndrome protein family member 1 [Eumeta japonica]
MPFVERVVEPKFVSRTSLRDEDGRPRVSDQELQAVTNCTLANALRQLASLVILAEDIFSELTAQLQGITERSKTAQLKIDKINELVENYDPKKVPVQRALSKNLFGWGPLWEKNPDSEVDQTTKTRTR